MLARSVFAVLAAVALLAPSLVVADVSIADRLARGQPPMIVAASKAVDTGYPEQSLAGFQWAIDRGVDVMVVSVQRTNDGQYIVLNDATLPRTTNVRDVFPDGPPRRDPGDAVAAWHLVADYKLDEIKRLRLLDSRGGDHPVPTLNEVLDLTGGRMLAVLKLDSYDAVSLAALLENRETKNILLFTWSDKEKLRELTKATGIGAWDSLVDEPDATAALEKSVDRFGPNLKIVDVEPAQLNSDLAGLANELGVRLCLDGAVEDMAIANDNSAPWMESLNKPVAAYTTKFPDAVLKLLGR